MLGAWVLDPDIGARLKHVPRPAAVTILLFAAVFGFVRVADTAPEDRGVTVVRTNIRRIRSDRFHKYGVHVLRVFRSRCRLW